MPLLSSRNRPLLVSFASGASLTAAIVVTGVTALAVVGFADELAVPFRGHDAKTIRLAEVPAAKAAEAHHAPAAGAVPRGPGPHLSSGRSAPPGATATRTAERRRTPRPTARQRPRVHREQPRPSVPRPQAPAAIESTAVPQTALTHSNGSDAPSSP